MQRPVSSPGDRLHFYACTGGVVATLVLYGVCQERIMTRPFDGAYFSHSLFLVLCNRLATIIVAAVTLTLREGARAARPAAPLSSYASVSLTNVAATSCQYEALKYVSFGAQTLAKCLKPVPVMAWGALWLRRSYGRADVGVALAVMTGCWLFMDGGSVAHRAVAGKEAAGAAAATATTLAHLAGSGLLAAYLAADGLTSTLQDRMFDRATVSAANQVLYVSLFSCAASLAALALGGAAGARAGVAGALAFCGDHPSAAAWIAALAASATASSLLITLTVRHYGALVLSLTMTVRQLASVLVSSATYGHLLTPREAAGAALVFGALFARSGARVRAAVASRAGVGSPSLPRRKPVGE